MMTQIITVSVDLSTVLTRMRFKGSSTIWAPDKPRIYSSATSGTEALSGDYSSNWL